MSKRVATAILSTLAVAPLGVTLASLFFSRPHWFVVALLLSGPVAAIVASVFIVRARPLAPVANFAALTVAMGGVVLTSPLLDGSLRELAFTCAQVFGLLLALAMTLLSLLELRRTARPPEAD